MVIVDALTNNVNRTASDVRAAFGKNGGNMGVSGSVAYMFDRVAVIGFEGKTADEALEILMDADVDAKDIIEEDDTVIVYAEPDQFHAVKKRSKRRDRGVFCGRVFNDCPQRSDAFRGCASTV